jgi:hypothetical protein
MNGSDHVGVNYVRLFASFYCAVIAAVISIRHADQFAYLKLTRSFEKPARVLNIWRVPPLSDGQFHAAGAGLVLALVMAAAGIFPRLALCAAAALYFLYFGQIISLSYVVRKIYLIPQVLLLLAAAPGIGQSLHAQTPRWPLLAVQAILAQMYLSSAFSKLRASGIGWARWTQLQGILLEHDLIYDLPFSSRVARKRWLCGTLGLAALVFELTFWIVLAAPRLSIPYAVAGLLLHISTLLLMRIDYLTYHSPVYLVFAVAPVARMLHGF